MESAGAILSLKASFDASRCSQVCSAAVAQCLCKAFVLLMEPRSHCDTAGGPGIKETVVTIQNLLETRLHDDTVGNHEIKEPIVTQRDRVEAMVHCYTADSRRPW